MSVRQTINLKNVFVKKLQIKHTNIWTNYDKRNDNINLHIPNYMTKMCYNKNWNKNPPEAG